MDAEKGNDAKFLFDYTSSLFHFTPLHLNRVFSRQISSQLQILSDS